MSADRSETRVYFRAKNPNPLFVEWLEHWLQEAEHKDSMKKCALAKALESLKKYPLVLYSGQDCAILDGFGSGICTMLDKQLKSYRENHPKKLLDEQQIEFREKSILLDVKNALEQKIKENEWKNATAKLDDTLEALLRNNDDLDVDMESAANLGATNSINCNPTPAAVCDFMPAKIRIASGSFKILLLVDTQETAGKSKRSLDVTLKALDDKNIAYEVRRLAVGDFMWICRDRSNASNELVLPYIVERKRIDDLASSIKDGRFHEQKFRLNDSGVKNKIYLIESRGNNSHAGLPLQTLLQASTNTQIYDQFTIKFTDSLNDSMLYLSVMTNLLIKMYKSKNVVAATKDDLKKLPNNYYNSISTRYEIELMDFKEFSESNGKMKNFTIRDLFMRQLLQLKTLSIDKALAIIAIYPTPRSLLMAYRNCEDEIEAAHLLADIRFGKLRRPVGAAISEAIYKLYHL